MIKYLKGDLFKSDAQALVNTVNTVGVMGKGIALQFKEKFPHNYKIYLSACKKGTFNIGQVLVVKDEGLMHDKIIINFPTKKHWKGNSKYEYIEEGLIALKNALIYNKISSVALPPLGCGHGGLEWEKVKAMIENELSDLNIEIFAYTPNEEIKAILQKENTKREVKLTAARAMLLYLLFQYESMGEQSSLFVANKLAYFLQRSGEKLRLKFEPHHYGPYTVQLNHVILYLNGVYLKGMEKNEAKPFDPFLLNYSKYKEIQDYINKQLTFEQRQRLNNVLKLIQGFESTFALELLASVDFISSRNNLNKVDDVIREILNWDDRKAKLFNDKYVKIAYNHLKNYASELDIH